MPKRAPHLNRQAAEAVLSAGDLTALRGQCVALGIPPDRWCHVPALARIWETIAAVRAAQRIEEATGESADSALLRACVGLGISPETVRSRLRRMVQDAYAGRS